MHHKFILLLQNINDTLFKALMYNALQKYLNALIMPCHSSHKALQNQLL